MIGNVYYWRRVFTETFRVEVDALRAGVTSRLLPSFEGLEAEADQVTDAEYQMLGQRWSGDSDLDEASATEMAYDAGLAFYERMTGVRQGLLNLATAGLYHLYEQQVAHFVRRELVKLWEESDERFTASLLKPNAIEKLFTERLTAARIDHRALPSSTALGELRLVANVVKHGAGKSAEDLHAQRPDLFIHPMLRDGAGASLRIYVPKTGWRRLVRADRPVLGEDLYITPVEFERYATVVQTFWSELALTLNERA